MAGKTNYLNNRDILKEIHLSKITYCSFADKATDHQFDVVVAHLDVIDADVIQQAKEARADRAKRATGEIIDPATIPVTDLVFRVTTWEHIPLAPPKTPRVKKKKIDTLFEFDEDIDEIVAEIVPPLDNTHIHLNFPPFYHYRLAETGTPFVVGKSHWKGDLTEGVFCKDHGQMTPTLARMFIKLCDRYATRSNWRGYCVDTETEALTQRGWLGIDKINDSDTILSYLDGDLKWSSIKSIYRGQYDGLMHHITSRTMDALVTPHHKFVTGRGLVEVELLKQSDQVVVMGNAVSVLEETINGKYLTESVSNDLSFSKVPYSGMVWCPETEFGSFVARRNGKVFLTGNSYNEEMRGTALLQLAQVGLRFDESKSQNPFAYLTAILTNSFTRVLNVEKKMQNIRDDILEINGLNPSWSRLNQSQAQTHTKYEE